MKSWVVTLETDPATGELILPLSDEILSDSGICIGDTIQWIDNKDGSWTLRKVDVNETKDATNS
jgi:hypothetical protein